MGPASRLESATQRSSNETPSSSPLFPGAYPQGKPANLRCKCKRAGNKICVPRVQSLVRSLATRLRTALPSPSATVGSNTIRRDRTLASLKRWPRILLYIYRQRKKKEKKKERRNKQKKKVIKRNGELELLNVIRDDGPGRSRYSVFFLVAGRPK